MVIDFMFSVAILSYTYIKLNIIKTENLALGKPTWEQYPWPDLKQNYGTGNAVDGKFSIRAAEGGHSTISNDGKYNATWRVDLGNVVTISYINIYYRSESYPCMFFLVTLCVVNLSFLAS